eukprot:scaffold4145_cov152-Skeletonema_menzelii.AAC.5
MAINAADIAYCFCANESGAELRALHFPFPERMNGLRKRGQGCSPVGEVFGLSTKGRVKKLSALSIHSFTKNPQQDLSIIFAEDETNQQ